MVYFYVYCFTVQCVHHIFQFYQPFLQSIAVTDHYYNASVCRLTLESHDQPGEAAVL